MKIVIVIDLIDCLTNGSVMTAKRFADGLRARGHEVRIAAIGADGEGDCNLKERKIPIVSRVAAKNQIKFAAFDKKSIEKVLLGADIVHFIFPFALEKKCRKLAEKMGIPCTAAFHVQPENITYNAHLKRCRPFAAIIYAYFRRSFYRHFYALHCPSQFIASQLEKHGYKSKLYVISNGCDADFIPPHEKYKHEFFEIVMTGRLTPEKNQQVIIKAGS